MFTGRMFGVQKPLDFVSSRLFKRLINQIYPLDLRHTIKFIVNFFLQDVLRPDFVFIVQAVNGMQTFDLFFLDNRFNMFNVFFEFLQIKENFSHQIAILFKNQ